MLDTLNALLINVPIENHHKNFMNTYNFTLILSDSRQQIDNLEDLLFEAGCDDATLSMSNGVTYLEFDREAEQFSIALDSAIQQVESIDNLFVLKKISENYLVTK